MKILVTGGTGFIGRHLVSALASGGHEVTVLSRRASSAKGMCCGDLVNSDLESIIPEGIEVVFHLAGVGSPVRCQSDPDLCWAVNVTATHRLLEVVRRLDLRRFVFVSSAYVYGDSAPIPTPEEAPLNPSTALGASKAAAEYLVRGYGASFGFPVTVFRLYTVYGPGSGEHQLIPSLIAQVRQDEPAMTIQDPRPTRDFMDITDAVRGLLSALSHAGLYEVLNLGTGVETSVGELCRCLLEISGRAKDVRQARAGSPGPVSRQCADITKIMATHGRQARIALRDGLARMLEGAEAELQHQREKIAH